MCTYRIRSQIDMSGEGKKKGRKEIQEMEKEKERDAETGEKKKVEKEAERQIGKGCTVCIQTKQALYLLLHIAVRLLQFSRLSAAHQNIHPLAECHSVHDSSMGIDTRHNQSRDWGKPV